jgi:hypothetical protein
MCLRRDNVEIDKEKERVKNLLSNPPGLKLPLGQPDI